MDKVIEKDIQSRTTPGWDGLSTPPGWDNLVSELHVELIRIDPDYTVQQIKEKFGGLRFYCNIQPREGEARSLIEIAEAKSYRTCQVCGVSGTTESINGWYSTLCDPCRKEK